MQLIKKCQKQILDKHALELSLSQRNEEKKDDKKKAEPTASPTNKLIIKNLAFQTNKEELQELFKNLFKFNKLRFPQKMDGTCRGFAFLEFDTIDECKEARRVAEGLHFYGRKLVFDFAEN